MTQALALPPLHALKAELCKRSLRRFVKAAWPVVQPNIPFVSNWHIDKLCQTLEKVTAGEIQRLLVNVPPGTMKSFLVSVFWPAWEWARDPSLGYLTASYEAGLTIRDNIRVRDIVDSEWYQESFPHVQFRADQNQKIRMDTTAAGWRIATSVGGRATGEHPDRIIIDDPHTATQARSDVERQTALDWFDRTISSRGVVKSARIVVIMQRLHEQDLSGHLLARGGWHHICWPMRYDPQVASPDDARTVSHELLWPELFPDQAIRLLELDLGPYGTAGQLQQRPAPEGGGLFKTEWFEYVSEAPFDCQWVRAWDAAGTAGDGDWTCGTKVGYSPSTTLYYVADVQRERLSDLGVNKLIATTAALDGTRCRQREEQEPGSSGKAVIGNRLHMLRGYDYAGVSPTGDKVTRAGPFRAQCEGRKVKLVRGPWNQAYLAELASFPVGQHDDQVDTSAYAFNEIVVNQPKPTIAAIGAKSYRDQAWLEATYRKGRR